MVEVHKMRVTIDINIEAARSSLYISAGSMEEAAIIDNMTEEEVKDKVLKHCKCWGITEAKD